MRSKSVVQDSEFYFEVINNFANNICFSIHNNYYI